MPIAVQCGGCSARLNAPDQAAGKAVRCPKCQQPVPVPAADPGFEVMDDPPPAAAKPARRERPSEDDDRPSKRRPSRDEHDDRPSKRRPVRDEDDDEDDRPPKTSRRRDEDDDEADRPRRQKPAGKSMKLLYWLIGGGVAFLALLLVLLFTILDRPDDKPMGTTGPRAANTPPPANNVPAPAPKPVADPPAANVPAGWVKFNDPLNEVTAYFPGPPEKNEDGSVRITMATGGPGDIWAVAAADKLFTLSRMTASAAEVKANKPEKLLFDALRGVGIGMPGANAGKFDLPVFDGGTVSRVVVFDLPNAGKRAVVRGVISGNRVLLGMVIGGPKIAAKDAAVKPFLDNLRFGT